MGGRHTGGCKGYKFEKRVCPRCQRKMAVNHFMLGHGKLRFRKHNDLYGAFCPGSREQFEAKDTE